MQFACAVAGSVPRFSCDASKAQDSAEAALMAEFDSMSKAAYTNIDNVGAQYDQETEHVTNGDKQKEWQGKYN